MLKLISNKGHSLEITEDSFAVTPKIEITEIVNKYRNDKLQLLTALSQLDSETVWAIEVESPKAPSLTRRQFRLALVANGYNLSDIEALINKIEDVGQRQFTQIEWQDANTFERHNQSLLLMASMLEISSDQLNQMWAQALEL